MRDFKDFKLKDQYDIKRAVEQQGFPDRVPSPLDLSGEHQMYGKVDRLSNAARLMIDDAGTLTHIRGSTNVYVVNFVARAFRDLKRDYETLIAKRALQPVLGMESLNPTSGWTDFSGHHASYVENAKFKILNACIKRFGGSIMDFGDFVKVFFQVLKESQEKIVMTKTGLLLSKKTPSNVSGLVLTLKRNLKNEEKLKIDMLSSPQFRVFAHKCAQFGFRLDRNAPWTLVANLNSSNLSPYGAPSGISLSPNGGNFFEKFYMKTHLEDMDLLRNVLPYIYNQFVSYRPFFRKTKTTESGQIEEWSYRRQPLIDPSDGYDTQFWMEVLLKIRLMETNLMNEINQKSFDNIISKCMKMESRYGLEVALNHLNEALKNVNYDLNIFAKNMRNLFTPQKLNHIILTIHKK